MTNHVLAGIAGGCLGFAFAEFALGDFPNGWLGMLCAIGFFVTWQKTWRVKDD